MIFPGQYQGKCAWFYLALMGIILSLFFVGYEARKSPAQPAAPKAAPLQHPR